MAMAEGAAGCSDADVGLALTGVAGPAEQDGQPVGTVFVGLSHRRACRGGAPSAARRPRPDAAVRRDLRRSTCCALRLLERELTERRRLSERLFVAVWPPDDVLDALARAAVGRRAGVRWTTRAQWHVTLRFLGDADVDEVITALDRVTAAPTEAVLASRTQRLGRGVLCVPVSGLDDARGRGRAATAGLGRPPDHRAFRGHITLARVDGRSKPPLTDLPGRRWPVATFALVRSHLGGGPARYETVATWPLRAMSDPHADRRRRPRRTLASTTR